MTSGEETMLATLSRIGTVAPEVIELFDYLEDTPLWMKDEAGHYEWVNVPFLLNFGVRTRAEIIGRNKAFVYNGRDANDAGRPFLTLHPGDRYNLATRRVTSRAIDATPLTQQFVDNVFASYVESASGGAAVLVAQDGKVLVNRAYGIGVQGRFTPETGTPHFALAGLSSVLNATLAPDSTGRLSAASVRRVTAMGGTQRLAYDSTTKLWTGNVDDLYRFDQARSAQNAEPNIAVDPCSVKSMSCSPRAS